MNSSYTLQQIGNATFGGSFRPGEFNAFYPLGTISGFSSTGIQRMLSPTNINLRLTPRPGFSYDLRADYDTKLRRLRDTSIWGSWQKGRVTLAGTYVKRTRSKPACSRQIMCRDNCCSKATAAFLPTSF
jgi:hypothetical protein